MFFYLKEPKADKETLIIIQYYINEKEKIFKYSTGIKIHPEDWDFNSRMPKTKKGASGVKLQKITAQLTPYSDFLVKYIDNSKLNNETVTKAKLKQSFDNHFKKTSLENTTFKYLTDYVEDFCNRAPNIVNRSTQKKYNLTKIKHYRKTNNILVDYEKYLRRRIYISDFDLKEYDKFVSYLSDVQQYSRNTTGDLVKNIKVFLKKAEEEGYLVNPDYAKFTVYKEVSESVALSEEEIQLLFDYDFSDNKRLENARDIAIIGLWTGLRVSDLLSLPKINPDDKFIEVKPQKTEDTSGIKVIIPLHHHIKEVLKKRGMPKMISDVKFNLYIKEVCQIVGFTQEVKGSLMNPNTHRKEVGLFPKYKLISSHTCRRSFATNLYKMNFPTLSIMKITGHTTEKSFLTYIKVTPKEHAEKLLAHWELYYGNR